jgi:hypothetical protein
LFCASACFTAVSTRKAAKLAVGLPSSSAHRSRASNTASGKVRLTRLLTVSRAYHRFYIGVKLEKAQKSKPAPPSFLGYGVLALAPLFNGDTRRNRELGSPVSLDRGGKATRADLSAFNINAFHDEGRLCNPLPCWY